MKNSFKLKILLAAVLMASSAAHANFANVPGDGTVGNAYQLGVIGPVPTVLAATVFGAPLSYFEDYADFTISGANSASASANTYTLNLAGFNLVEITGLTVEVWDNVHPLGSTLYTAFSGNNATNSFSLPDGQYHLDISGYLGSTASIGQYSVAISAVPEPETYAMLLAGLGLVGFSARRRKIAYRLGH